MSPLRIGLLLFYTGLGSVLPAQFVSMEGRRFMLNGQPFYPVVMNYGFEWTTNVSHSADAADYYWSVRTAYDRSINGSFECNSFPTCVTQLQQHFAKVTSMGFNTVRVFGIGPHLRNVNGSWRCSLLVKDQGAHFPDQYYVDLDGPDYDDAFSTAYFNDLRALLDQAELAGLKVILLCADDPGMDHPEQLVPFMNSTTSSFYANYLARLAEEVGDHPAVLAYDLWNEPKWTNWDYSNALLKADVCSFTTQWYDILHEHGAEQLVTLGGSGVTEMNTWDPTVMKLDFYSPHIYPSAWSYDNYNVIRMISRVKDEVYWNWKAGSMPYIIGETGFSAEDSFDDHYENPNNNHLDADPAHHRMPWMNGSESQQALYAQETLDAVARYGGSGYSWWEFQNSREANLEGNSPSSYRGNFWGLLKYGDGTTSWFDKLAVPVFQDYQYESGLNPYMPSNYTNWYVLGTNMAPLRKWYMQDTDGPITDAVIECEYVYYQNNSNSQHFSLFADYVPDQDGGVSLFPGPTIGGWYCSQLRVRVDIPSAKPVVYHANVDWPSDQSVVSYSRQRFPYDYVIESVQVDVEEVVDKKAWATIEVINGEVAGGENSGGSLMLHARESVSLTSEFHAARGSEVHMWTEQTFPDCSSEDYRNLVESTSEAHSIADMSTAQLRKTLELQFKGVDETINVYPNPTERFVTISSKGGGTYSIFSGAGAFLSGGKLSSKAVVVDLGYLASGNYIFRFEENGVLQEKNITKLP